MKYAAKFCSTPNKKFNQTDYEYFGAIQHTGSKCFHSDISQTDFYNSYASTKNDRGFKCMNAYCDVNENGKAVIKIVFVNYTLQCNVSNTWASPDEGSGYSGIIFCPDIQQFCEVHPRDCLNGCNGNGICVDGVCQCFDFIEGEDCNHFGKKFKINGTGLANRTTSLKHQYFY